MYNYKPLKCVELMKMKGPMIFLHSVWSNLSACHWYFNWNNPGSMTVETESLTPCMSKWWGQISEWPHSQLFGVYPDTLGLSFSNNVNINTIISRKGQRKGNLNF